MTKPKFVFRMNFSLDWQKMTKPKFIFGMNFPLDWRVRISNFHNPPPSCHGLGYEGGRSELTSGAFAPVGHVHATLQVEFEAENDEFQVFSE